MYKGLLIKESISNELILDLITIEKVEIWKTNDVVKYWTAISFTSEFVNFPDELSKVLTSNWYVDMKVEDTKILVFKDKVLRYEIGNIIEKVKVIDYCRSIGIPEDQLDWSE